MTDSLSIVHCTVSHIYEYMYVINPRRACAKRVTVLAWCVCVCVCVCVLIVSSSSCYTACS